MNQEELFQLAQQHGGVTGITAIDPTLKQTQDEDTAEGTKTVTREVPNPNPQYRFVYGDGSQIVLRWARTENGGEVYDVVEPLKGGPGKAATETDQQNQQAHTAQTQAQTQQLQAEEAEKNKNAANGFGRITDAELAKQQSSAAQQAQAGGQADRAAAQRDREISIADANSKIAALNASTQAQAKDIEDRIAEQKLTQEQAVFEYQKIKDAYDRDYNQQKLRIDAAQQQSTAEYQSGQLANQQGQLANQTAQTQETARANQAAEQYRQQDLARNAAGDILQNEQAQQTQATQRGNIGAGLLNQRVQSGTGLLNSLVGLAGSGKMYNVPAGLGQSLVGGVQNFVTGLGGGQGVYDTAAKIVQNLAPSMPSDRAALATGVLQQMLERYQGQTGQTHPVADQVANMAPQDQQASTFTAPPYQGAPNPNVFGSGGGQPVININFHSPQPQQMADTNMAGPQRGALSG